MKNKDAQRLSRLAAAQKISDAAKAGDEEAFKEGLNELCLDIEAQIMEEAKNLREETDAAVLAQRGVRQLTNEEKEYYNTLIGAMKAPGKEGVKMALSNVDKAFPLTIINDVMEDMKQEHPLLAAVETRNVTGLTKWLMNTDEGASATWDELETEITKEIASGFNDLELDQKKLSAWMPISQDMLELGPNWLDAYIRTCLSEALAIGFENGIVTGTGKKMPIGMDRQVQENVVIIGGVYPKKDAIAVTDFSPATYGNLISQLTVSETGKVRAVNGLVMVVNPFDYYKLVMPATTVMLPDGTYRNDVFPVPTKVIQSVAVERDEAILGIGKRYFLGVGGKRGIQFSDDAQFLADKRLYKIVAYANGRAKDNNSFLRLDISGLKRLIYEVKAVDSANF